MKGFYEEFTLLGLAMAIYEIMKLLVLAGRTVRLHQNQLKRFSLNQPSGPIQSLSWDGRWSVRLPCIPVDRTLLVKECTGNIGKPLEVFGFLMILMTFCI